MEIKRNFEKLTVTKRRFVVRQPPSEQRTCAECEETMLPIAQAAIFFRLKQSRIFQIVETGGVHFTEVEPGTLMICLSSLAAVLEADEKK